MGVTYLVIQIRVSPLHLLNRCDLKWNAFSEREPWFCERFWTYSSCLHTWVKTPKVVAHWCKTTWGCEFSFCTSPRLSPLNSLERISVNRSFVGVGSTAYPECPAIRCVPSRERVRITADRFVISVTSGSSVREDRTHHGTEISAHDEVKSHGTHCSSCVH